MEKFIAENELKILLSANANLLEIFASLHSYSSVSNNPQYVLLNKWLKKYQSIANDCFSQIEKTFLQKINEFSYNEDSDKFSFYAKVWFLEQKLNGLGNIPINEIEPNTFDDFFKDFNYTVLFIKNAHKFTKNNSYSGKTFFENFITSISSVYNGANKTQKKELMDVFIEFLGKVPEKSKHSLSLDNLMDFNYLSNNFIDDFIIEVSSLKTTSAVLFKSAFVFDMRGEGKNNALLENIYSKIPPDEKFIKSDSFVDKMSFNFIYLKMDDFENKINLIKKSNYLSAGENVFPKMKICKSLIKNIVKNIVLINSSDVSSFQLDKMLKSFDFTKSEIQKLSDSAYNITLSNLKTPGVATKFKHIQKIDKLGPELKSENSLSSGFDLLSFLNENLDIFDKKAKPSKTLEKNISVLLENEDIPQVVKNAMIMILEPKFAKQKSFFLPKIKSLPNNNNFWNLQKYKMKNDAKKNIESFTSSWATLANKGELLASIKSTSSNPPLTKKVLKI